MSNKKFAFTIISLLLVMITGFGLIVRNNHDIAEAVGSLLVVASVVITIGLNLCNKFDLPQPQHLPADKLPASRPRPHIKTTTSLGGNPKPDIDSKHFLP